MSQHEGQATQIDQTVELVERRKGEDRHKVSAYLEYELAARLREHGYVHNTKISDVIAEALERYLDVDPE